MYINIIKTMANVDSNNFFISMLSLLDEKIYVNSLLKENVNVIAIQDNIRKFLISNCNHEVETDYIDLTPEKSYKIVYCTKCMMNL
jgi:hypothetical protein